MVRFRTHHTDRFKIVNAFFDDFLEPYIDSELVGDCGILHSESIAGRVKTAAAMVKFFYTRIEEDPTAFTTEFTEDGMIEFIHSLKVHGDRYDGRNANILGYTIYKEKPYADVYIESCRSGINSPHNRDYCGIHIRFHYVDVLVEG